MSVLDPKAKQSLWLITRDADNLMNQSELAANTCSRRQARENACEQIMIGFGFTSDWSRRGARFFSQSHHKQYHRKLLLSSFHLNGHT